MDQQKKRSYEYELHIARLDTAERAIRVSSIDLTKAAAFVIGGGFGFCGLGICSIQARKKADGGQSPTTLARA
jgi:hypothetical protein